MRVSVVFVLLVLFAVFASISADASLVSASGRRRARSILQPTAKAVLRNKLQVKTGARVAASTSASVNDKVTDAEDALRKARLQLDKAYAGLSNKPQLSAKQRERADPFKELAKQAFAKNDLKVAQEAVASATRGLENARYIQQLEVNAAADKNPDVIFARKLFESARAKKVMNPNNKALVADFESAKRKWTLAVLSARVAIRFPSPPPKPVTPPAPAKTAAVAPAAQQKTSAAPAPQTKTASASASAAAPAARAASGGATAAVVAVADPYAESLRKQRQYNPANQMHRGIEYVADELDQGMRASMINDGINPDGALGTVCRTIPNTFWRMLTSIGTAIGKISLASHDAAEASHAGVAGSTIAKNFVSDAGPAAVQMAITGATFGAAAGSEGAFVSYAVQTAQGFATEFAATTVVNSLPLPPESGAAVAASAIGALASKSLLSVSSNAQAQVSASATNRALDLTKAFKTNGAARVTLAMFLAAHRGLNLGAEVNTALTSLGLPPSPLSATDVIRTLLRVKYVGNTISEKELRLTEAMLDGPRFQKVADDALRRAADMTSDIVKTFPTQK